MNKILFVVDERKIGGTSKVLETVFENIPELEADVLVLHNVGNRFETIKNMNLIYGTSIFDVCDVSLIETIKSKNIFRVLKKLFFAFLIKTNLIKWVIKKERKKILKNPYEIEVSFKDGFGNFFVAYGDSKKKIKWIHNDFSRNNPAKNYKKSYKKALDKFDLFIAISETIKKNFNDKFDKTDRSIVVKNMVEIPIKDVAEVKKYNFVMCVVGRLVKLKRYDMIINIVNELNKEKLFNNSILKIVGDGEEKSRLNAMVSNYNLNDKVKFYGLQEKPWSIVSDSDLFVMSSIYEACPLTIVEAQLMNIPVISVSLASSTEMICKRNGIIVENSYAALYNGIKDLILDRNKLDKYKRNLKNFRYDNIEIVDKIKKILDLKR